MGISGVIFDCTTYLRNLPLILLLIRTRKSSKAIDMTLGERLHAFWLCSIIDIQSVHMSKQIQRNIPQKKKKKTILARELGSGGDSLY